ncbi:MAG TPA: phosphoglycolate phosphatase [Paracoccus sp. (in: a-proteobacteria)]|nr:phosphoglycolate phosphatase [Paracoccus sp. (in: a-proteobacteria)]
MIVIFDLDGTLIDSAPDIHATSNIVLAAQGLDALSLAEVRGFIGRGVPHLVDCLLYRHGIRDAGLAAHMAAEFTRHYETAVTLTRPYAGVPETLRALSGMGRRLAVCTNKPVSPARAVLAHLGLAQHFTAVIGGDSLPRRKPDPAPLRLAHAACGGGPVLYVGDSEVDAECARAAAIPFALFTEGYRRTPVEDLPHAAAFDDFARLVQLVEAFAAQADGSARRLSNA